MHSLSLTKAVVSTLLLTVWTSAQSCKVTDVQFSFFGLGSAGTLTAYPCPGQNSAQNSYEGDGSYDNPSLAAVSGSDGRFQRCEIIYASVTKKYYRINDLCGCPFGLKVDLWVGPSPKAGWTDGQLPTQYPNRDDAGKCEGAYGTPMGTVIQNPAKDLPVETHTLYSGPGTCKDKDPSYIFSGGATTCSGGSSNGGQTNPSSVVAAPPVASSPGTGTGNYRPPVANAYIQEEKLSVPDPSSASGPEFPKLTGLPKFEGVKALEFNAEPNPSSSAPPTSPSDTSGGGRGGGRNRGDPCPANDWFPGCVWGSGTGQLGASCSSKTDCFGEYVCIGGKCLDNVNPGNKAKRGGARHRRRHVAERAGVEVGKH